MARVRTTKNWLASPVGWMMAAFLSLASPAWSHGSDEQRSASLDQRLLLAPADPLTHLRRAGFLFEQGRRLEASAALLTAESLGAPMPAVDGLRARIALADQRPAEALAAAERVLALENNDPVQRTRAAALLALGRPAEAAAAFAAAIAAAPVASPDDYLDAARAYRTSGDLERGIAILDLGLHRLGPLAALQQLAVELEVERRAYSNAVARLDSLLVRNPRNLKWLERRRQLGPLAQVNGAVSR